MEYIVGKTDFKFQNTAVSLGKFDGLHKGHQLLLNKIIELKKDGLTSVMFTFMSHPQNFLFHKNLELIYTPDEKRYLLEQWGLDILISYPFTKDVASMKPQDFVKEILIDKLDAKMVVVGSDFHFGHNRQGNVDLLKELSLKYGFELLIYDKVKIENQIVSSTIIRDAIQKGNIESANLLLGRAFTVIGEVEHGRKIGRTLGFPTTNIIPTANKLLPPNGVYVTKTKIDGRKYPGITNIGFNPTVGKTSEKRIETYLFEFNSDLYGKRIEVEFLTMERPEIKFESMELLKAQIGKDMEFGKKYFDIK
jgi:riboflavin kinase / FMN adenylyltransferase